MHLTLTLEETPPTCPECGEPTINTGLEWFCPDCDVPHQCPTCGSLSPWRCGCHHDFDDAGD
jgi:hypothetical protein